MRLAFEAAQQNSQELLATSKGSKTIAREDIKQEESELLPSERQKLHDGFSLFYKFTLPTAWVPDDKTMSLIVKSVSNGTIITPRLSDKDVTQLHAERSKRKYSPLSETARTAVTFLSQLRILMLGYVLGSFTKEVSATTAPFLHLTTALDYLAMVEMKMNRSPRPTLHQVDEADLASRKEWSNLIRIKNCTLNAAILECKISTLGLWILPSNPLSFPLETNRKRQAPDASSKPRKYIKQTPEGEAICENFNKYRGCTWTDCPMKLLQFMPQRPCKL